MFKCINSRVAICMYLHEYIDWNSTFSTYRNAHCIMYYYVQYVLLIVVSRERYINRGTNTYNASRDINIWYLNLDQRCNHAGAC